MQQIQVPSLVWEDPLQEELATHSSVLAWRIPWTEEPGGLQAMGPQRVGHDGAFMIILHLRGSSVTECLWEEGEGPKNEEAESFWKNY